MTRIGPNLPIRLGMVTLRLLALVALASLFLPACRSVATLLAPPDRLTFPSKPAEETPDERRYDVNGNGVVDFAILRGANGLLDVLHYDDDEDGTFDRSYCISDYDAEEVPHLLLLVDSIPYRVAAARYAAGDLNWFQPPQKVIAPFPSLSEVTFTEILRAPKLAGVIERYYDKGKKRIRNLYIARAFGYEHPWQERLDYHLGSYLRVGMSYLRPRSWYGPELSGAKDAIDRSTRRMTLAYVVTSSSMTSRFGAQGLQECLDRIEQLCLQLLYERKGAIKISLVSDHGHNLLPSTNFLMTKILEEAGFHPTHTIRDPTTDVVMEIDGLVTYFGVHTGRPEAVADALLPSKEVQLALYLDGKRIVVRNKDGAAVIERRGRRFRYTAMTADVLSYASVVQKLRMERKVDREGFVDDRDWFDATCNHEWPDAPRRVWDAFHDLVLYPADVMFTLNDGYCAGARSMDKWIEMQSTHGGLNQINSDATLMTMIGPIEHPLRSCEVLAYVAPEFPASRE